MSDDRQYLDGAVKVKRNTITILKNMNSNVLQRAREFDYSFISRLILEVFDVATLRNSTAFSTNMQRTAYARLDEQKYEFVRQVFQERIKGSVDEKMRQNQLNNLVNKRCAALRSRNFPKRKI